MDEEYFTDTEAGLGAKHVPCSLKKSGKKSTILFYQNVVNQASRADFDGDGCDGCACDFIDGFQSPGVNNADIFNRRNGA